MSGGYGPGPGMAHLTGEELGVGPDLTLSAPATGYVDEPVFIDAYPSTGVSDSVQSDMTPSVTIDFGDDYTANLLRPSHIYREAGTYTITVNGKNSDGEAGTEVSQEIVISNIPTATGGAIQNLTDSGNAATNKTNLQNAINTAAAANSVEQEIRLNGDWTTAIDCGIILTVPTGGSKYITIIWTGLTVPHRKRVTPSDFTNAPTILACTAGVTAGLRTPDTATNPPSHHYRIIGIRVKKDSPTTYWNAPLIQIGLDANNQPTVAHAPHHFIIQHCWPDGGLGDDEYTKDGIRIYADYVSVVDSYIAENKIISGPDATAISLAGKWVAIWNNALVAGAENLFVGGSLNERNQGTVSSPTTTSCTLSSTTNLEVDRTIAFKVGGTYHPDWTTIVRSVSGSNITFDAIGTAPDNSSTAEWIVDAAYIEVRQNYIYKPLKWFPRGGSWNSTTYQIKNLWEIKNGRYVVNEGNVFHRSWLGDQNYAIQVSPRNVNGGYSVATNVREIQFTNNIIRDVAGVYQISPGDDYIFTGPGSPGTSPAGYPSANTEGIWFRNNLVWNWGNNWDSDSFFTLFFLAESGEYVTKRAFWIHNTADNVNNTINSQAIGTASAIQPNSANSFWVNSLQRDGGLGFSGPGTNVQNLATMLPPGTSANTDGNKLVNNNSRTYPAWWIVENGTWGSEFEDYSAGDFTLAGGNSGIGQATDGTDVGVIMASLTTAIGAPSSNLNTDWASIKAVSGDWS